MIPFSYFVEVVKETATARVITDCDSSEVKPNTPCLTVTLTMTLECPVCRDYYDFVKTTHLWLPIPKSDVGREMKINAAVGYILYDSEFICNGCGVPSHIRPMEIVKELLRERITKEVTIVSY